MSSAEPRDLMKLEVMPPNVLVAVSDGPDSMRDLPDADAHLSRGQPTATRCRPYHPLPYPGTLAALLRSSSTPELARPEGTCCKHALRYSTTTTRATARAGGAPR